MRLAFITPTAFVEKFGSQGDFTLALSHLMDLKEVNEYEKAITKVGLPILCDNGLFENHVPESLETLIKKAERIGATHFFAPDILYSSEGTQLELDKAILAAEKSPVKVAAVVQASNVQDYMSQLLDFNNNPKVDLIGLSILSIPKSFREVTGTDDISTNRIALLKSMKKMADGGVKWKNCHMLGLGNDYADVIFATKYCLS